ncbi:hypothetical protein T484DRAFT_1755359 [Baffinella frigidus]|nr:hypothetical protein T484DRAFT_1755359 [Cryptophyta sp. CCMP2293]
MLNIVQGHVQNRDWCRVVCWAGRMYELYDTTSQVAQAVKDKFDNIYDTQNPGSALQDRWTTTATNEQVLHWFSFAHGQHFAAIGVPDTATMLSEVAEYTLQVNSLYELAVALGKSEGTGTANELSEAITRLKVLYSSGLRSARDSELQPIALPSSLSPIDSRDLTEPLVEERTTGVHAMEHARWLYVTALLAHKEGRRETVVRGCFEGMLKFITVVQVDRPRVCYDMLRAVYSFVKTWTPSLHQQEVANLVDDRMVELIGQMHRNKELYTASKQLYTASKGLSRA